MFIVANMARAATLNSEDLAINDFSNDTAVAYLQYRSIFLKVLAIIYLPVSSRYLHESYSFYKVKLTPAACCSVERREEAYCKTCFRDT